MWVVLRGWWWLLKGLMKSCQKPTTQMSLNWWTIIAFACSFKSSFSQIERFALRSQMPLSKKFFYSITGGVKCPNWSFAFTMPEHLGDWDSIASFGSILDAFSLVNREREHLPHENKSTEIGCKCLNRVTHHWWFKLINSNDKNRQSTNSCQHCPRIPGLVWLTNVYLRSQSEVQDWLEI